MPPWTSSFCLFVFPWVWVWPIFLLGKDFFHSTLKYMCVVHTSPFPLSSPVLPFPFPSFTTLPLHLKVTVLQYTVTFLESHSRCPDVGINITNLILRNLLLLKWSLAYFLIYFLKNWNMVALHCCVNIYVYMFIDIDIPSFLDFLPIWVTAELWMKFPY